MKKIFFLSALLCASLMVSAKEYCGEPSSNSDFTFSLTHVSGNTYRVQIDAVGADEMEAAVNINTGVNQTAGPGLVLAASEWVVAPKQAYIEFETASEESVPTAFYVDYMAFAKVGGGVIELNLGITEEIDWTSTCGAATKTDPELALNATEKTLDAAASETFQIVPSSKGDGAISYASSNEGIASVSDAGLVTAVGRGTATITVKVAETETYAAASKKLVVTVTGPINWDAVEWLPGSNNKFKVVAEPEIGAQFGGMHVEAENIWIGFPVAEFGECSIEYSAIGAGVSFAISNFPKQFNTFTMVCGGTTYTIIVFNADGSITSNDEMSTIKPQLSIQKLIEDGQLIIIRDGVRFNAAGQQIK